VGGVGVRTLRCHHHPHGGAGLVNDPTANMVRAFEIREGDWIWTHDWRDWPFQVDMIEPLGGDEMGPALWRFTDCAPWIGGSVDYPYAALVEKYQA
jgi:putative component of membrane protein insertase Oxa1/YidC/SpoIIIJ protein YidD